MGFPSELEYDILLARDLHFPSSSKDEQRAAEVIEVKRMLALFIPKLRADR
jgi:hypothetical protein